MDDGASKRNFYLQYPLSFRRDKFVLRLENKFGLAAPMIWLELNAYSADKGFVISKDPDDEDWSSQLVMDLGYNNVYKEQAKELFEEVLQYAIKWGEVILTKTEDEESLYFPWAERQTMSRTMDAEKQARYRDRQKGKEESSTQDRTKGNICYQSVTPVLPPVTDPVTHGNGAVTIPNECYHSKNKSIDIDINKEKEKETKINLQREREVEAGGQADPFGETPTLPPPKNLTPLILHDGTKWVPDPELWYKITTAFGDLNLLGEFLGMDLWTKSNTGGKLPPSEDPQMFMWRWLGRTQTNNARVIAEGIAKARAGAEKEARKAPPKENKGAVKARSQQESFAAAFRAIQEEEEAEKKGGSPS